MITCCIRYTLDPHRIADFERYATAWSPIIARCGGALLGYFTSSRCELGVTPSATSQGRCERQSNRL